MFESQIAANRFQLAFFSKVIADISEDSFFQPGVGHGHPPAWILGHLTIVAEMGQQLLGGKVTHPAWLPVFGPGSSGEVPVRDEFAKGPMTDALLAAYQGLQERAAAADEATVSRPHGVPLLEGTPIVTVEDAITLLLTNHFGFHLAQLSSCRRAAGFGPLF